MLAGLISAIVGALASSIAAAYFKYRADRADEALKQRVPALEAERDDLKATIAQRDDLIARQEKSIEQLHGALDEARNRLAENLGPDAARFWLRDVLSGGSGPKTGS